MKRSILSILSAYLVVLVSVVVACFYMGNALATPLARPIATPCVPTGTIVPSPNVGSASNYLNGIGVVSANDMWAVGHYYNGSKYRTLIEHWNGSAWTVVPSPNVGADDNYLFAVGVVSATDVWAVGSYLNVGADQTLVVHWDGGAWTVIPSPSLSIYNDLYAVAGVSANDVWAVGRYFNGSTSQTLIEHWDGTTWTVAPSPNVGASANAFTGVDVVSASDIWAVGNYSDDGSVYQTLVAHWDGSTWTTVPSPNVGSSSNVLRVVDAVSSSDVWAVGYYFGSATSQTLIEHWDGTIWTVVPSPSPGTASSFNGIGAVSANDVWAVGYYNNGSTSETLVEHWDGTTWTVLSSPNPGVNNFLNAVGAVSANDVWVVGEYHNGSAYRTLTIQYTADCATSTETAATLTNTPTGTPTYIATNTPTSTPVSPTVPTGTPTDTPVVPPTITPGVPTETPTACTLSFEDVPPDHTFYAYIQCLACRGIINGYPCGGVGEPCNSNNDPYFRPGNNVTRGQFAKIASNSAGFTETPGPQQYEDVAPGSTFYDFVWRLTNRGFINGYPCGGAGEPCGGGNIPYFRPNANVTRGQIAKIDANAAGLLEPPGAQQYEDVAPGSTFYDYIWRLSDRGYINGYPCGGTGEPCGPNNLPYFRPGANATRGQASKIVSNTFFPSCNP